MKGNSPLAIPDRASLRDEDLLSRFLKGDERCFEELMNRYRGRVYRLAMRFLGRDSAAAEDIAQQVFVKVFTSGKTFRGSGSFKSWLFTIAANHALTEWRRRDRFVHMVPEQGWEKDLNAGLDDAVSSARLDAAISMLPEKQKLVLTLRLDGELPFEEIAKVAAMSKNSAKVNFHHAVVSLKRKLSGGNCNEM